MKTIDIKASQEELEIKNKFKRFVIETGHPCVMAQTMFRMDKVNLKIYDHFGSEEAALKILTDLNGYLAEYEFGSDDFYTFMAVFNDETRYSEEQFEKQLWSQLQHLHNLDDHPWDPKVSSDPESRKFSFSLLGEAFYIVGMHPGSSRKARRSC